MPSAAQAKYRQVCSRPACPGAVVKSAASLRTLSLLPVTATLIGVIVLGPIPSLTDCLGIALVAAGVAFHKPADA